jgi:hypothetical protein
VRQEHLLLQVVYGAHFQHFDVHLEQNFQQDLQHHYFLQHD